MQIWPQIQPEGAPLGSDSGNCLQLAKTVAGFQKPYSITSQWDPNSGLFGIFLLNNDGCSITPNPDNSIALSPFIYTMSDKGLPFFTGLGATSSGPTGVTNLNIPPGSNGFYEVNFNYGTKYGQGITSNGIGSFSTRLTAPIINSLALSLIHI